MPFIEVSYTNTNEEISNMLVAILSDSGYDGFEEEAGSLKAFVPQDLFNNDLAGDLAARFHLKYSTREIADTNWNNVWESNFLPVVVDDFCAVRAHFHETIGSVKHEIVITPKMSFGTGHHATTFMMMKQMEDIEFTGKNVLDFGTGTGVLAILASRLGARFVTAIDNDQWSIENAAENIAANNITNVGLQKADTAATRGIFDVILANITRNVILDNFALFITRLPDNGTLLLSGLLQDDEQHIHEKAQMYQLKLINKTLRDNWISLRFSK